jgi:phenylpyruvate tautomerase PptA (4-oxalocrotonate tautomerase family)
MNKSCESVERGQDSPEPAALSRRALLTTATVAAGSIAGASTAFSQPVATVGFGVPLVEVYVPAGALTSEQKGEMIKGVFDVIVNAVKPSPEQASRLWVEILETAESGWGVGGKVFVPRSR